MKVTGYERIKELQKELRKQGIKRTIKELLVEDPRNDPFYAGTPACKAMAEWFANLWHQFGYGTGIHLRRVHYQIFTQGLMKYDGITRYANTEKDWTHLCTAGAQARYLGLVDPQAFVDRRNPAPHIYTTLMDELSPNFEVEFPEWSWPEIDGFNLSLPGITRFDDWELPRFYIYGVEYGDGLQPYHMEIWCEKSTMNDVLLPLCQQYHVNLITGVGYLSITSVINLLQRIHRIGKPVRIFYVSDFDPSGDTMPFSAARQIEFWVQNFGTWNKNIKLTPIVLTEKQVSRYNLPRVPIKDEDKGKCNFEERYGEGATELDALEALYPGELARIAKEAILQYWDEDLGSKVREAVEDLEKDLSEKFKSALLPFCGTLTTLRDEIQQITKSYREDISRLNEQVYKLIEPHKKELGAIREEMEEKLEPYREQLASLREAIEEEIEKITIGDFVLPEFEPYEEDGEWLFDSSRDYMSQLEMYKAFKNGVNRD
ncbi:hypothetical protein M1N47_03655 [Dehalococcoidia bacterium]|nr:hypothetical protein [Dehalococcoidia bacterium]